MKLLWCLPAMVVLLAAAVDARAQTAQQPVAAARGAKLVAMPPQAVVATPEELAIAGRVHVGHMPCEMGQAVTLKADDRAPGHFDLHIKPHKFRMFPVATTTGAIRLEDHKAGVVWLQLANKSMLMNHKLGQRLADACMSPAQIEVAAAMEKNPVRSVLDSPDATAPAGATK
jgi:hypothetical protein